MDNINQEQQMIEGLLASSDKPTRKNGLILLFDRSKTEAWAQHRLMSLRNCWMWLVQVSGLSLKSLEEVLALEWLPLNNLALTELPECIGALRRLKGLDLSNNLLVCLPESICKPSELQELYLSGNRLKKLPECIGELQQLTSLYLNNNPRVQLPEGMSKLNKLRILGLSGNRLFILPRWMDKLHELTWIDLSQNEFTRFPDHLKALRKINWLDMRYNLLTVTPEGFATIKHLLFEYNYIKTHPKDLLNRNDLHGQIERPFSQLQGPASPNTITRLDH